MSSAYNIDFTPRARQTANDLRSPLCWRVKRAGTLHSRKRRVLLGGNGDTYFCSDASSTPPMLIHLDASSYSLGRRRSTGLALQLVLHASTVGGDVRKSGEALRAQHFRQIAKYESIGLHSNRSRRRRLSSTSTAQIHRIVLPMLVRITL